MTVYKQSLEITGEKSYSLTGSRVKPLCVAEQKGNLCLWYETDGDEKTTTDITILIIGTGHIQHEIGIADYIGTVVMSYCMVWHCYYKRAVNE